ncbi:MAG: glycoside hydrolase family 2 protein [Terriglobales bacterium]
MDRRKFLETTGAVIAGAALSGISVADTLAFESEARNSLARLVLPINQNWRFSPRVVDGFQTREFDDSGFEQVTIPHSNKKLPWHSFDEKSYHFVSAYRRRVKLPPETRGKRVFVDFEGVMTASTVWINGHKLGEYKGGYTPFSFELTPHLDWDGDNLLAVAVDSNERPDIPPFGDVIDYLTFGGIYREVALRVVPATFIENIFAKPRDVLSDHPGVDIECFVSTLENNQGPLSLEAELRYGSQVIARAEQPIPAADITTEPVAHSLRMDKLPNIKLWDLKQPNLYTVVVRILRGAQLVDEDTRRFGFREASFTEEGFKLNGEVVKLRGLNRHQTFPFVGQAMPRRVQRRDAIILKKELRCNLVRTSHYPQSRHFLDCCDEIGLLVLEEIPGWQHIGDEVWKSLAVDNVRRMIRRDWNHPAIVLWGVRINESKDDHDFYTRTNALAHALDPTRQTGGIRYFQHSEFLEDVFTMNDFGFPLKAPNHPRYLNTEFVGHTFDTKSFDNNGRLTEHTLRHARIHNLIAGNAQYAGGIGWCAFDYNTHADFGSGDRVCYHGVSDIFREPKPAAGFYKSQCEPDEELVLEPAFHWSASDEYNWYKKVVVCSNCDHLKFYVGNRLVAEADPNRAEFGNLRYPPFFTDLSKVDDWTGDLRIEGYIAGTQVVSKSYSGKAIDQKFELRADDDLLRADRADATRVVFRVTDEYGAVRPYATAAIVLRLEGPAELIGDNPFALIGGVGAVWIRAKQQAGTVVLHAKHPTLGAQDLKIQISAAAMESA